MEANLVSALVAPVIAGLVGLALTWLDNRDDRQQRHRTFDLAQKQVDFIAAWVALREQLATDDDNALPGSIHDDMLDAYSRAMSQRAPAARTSPWRRFSTAVFPPKELHSVWAQLCRTLYWVMSVLGVAAVGF